MMMILLAAAGREEWVQVGEGGSGDSLQPEYFNDDYEEKEEDDDDED